MKEKGDGGIQIVTELCVKGLYYVTKLFVKELVVKGMWAKEFCVKVLCVKSCV